MRQLRAPLVMIFLLGASCVFAAVYTVDPSGGGDFTSLPLAFYHTGAADTVMLMPGTHWVGQGWPITLTPNSPSVTSRDGAAQTVVLGDGTRAAFRIQNLPQSVRMHFQGITFRSIGTLFKFDGDDYTAYHDLLFTDNVVEDCRSTYAVEVRECAPSSYVARNVIRNNTGVGFHTYHNSGIFEDNEICYNAGGIRGGCCENPKIRRNHIHHNTSYGIIPGTFYFTVLENIIEHNAGLGVYANDYCRIERNVIRYNRVGIRAHRTNCSCRYNDIYGNTDFSIETIGTYGSVSYWNCSDNWWGTTDPVAIAASIRDCQDDSVLKLCVQFEPWCVLPGCAVSDVRPATWTSIKALYR